MIVLSTSAAQTIQPGGTASFDVTALHTGCSEQHRNGSGAVRLRGGGCYSIEFNGNVGGAAATQPNLALAIDGSPLRETTMTATISLDTDVQNVSATTKVRTLCGCCESVTVVNVGTTPVTLQAGAALNVTRLG